MTEITNSEFAKLSANYETVINRWYRNAYKAVQIDKDEFIVEFQYILFKSMLHFSIDKAENPDDKFERYFHSALKKRINSLIRKNSSKKKNLEKRTISLSLKKHDLADSRYVSGLDNAELSDMLNFCSSLKDSGIIRMRMGGATAKDVCKTLEISAVEYRKIMNRIRSNSGLQHSLSLQGDAGFLLPKR